MAVLKRYYIEEEQPQIAEGLWLKKVSGGYSLYLIVGGVAQPLKLVDDNSTTTPTDDVVEPGSSATYDEIVGSVQDTGTADTINGAKAYADSVGEAITGTAEDTSEDLTLYGLKAYIDSKTTNSGGGGNDDVA